MASHVVSKVLGFSGARAASPCFLPPFSKNGKLYGFSGGGRRFQVSFAAVIERAESVLPCYAILERQVKPQVTEDKRQEGQGYVHSISWRFEDGRELRVEKEARSKRGARNNAARALIQELAAGRGGVDAAVLDPVQNGALAQWAVEWLNRKFDASMELQEAVEEAAEGEGHGDQGGFDNNSGHAAPETTHNCTWTCPQLQGETAVSGTASSAAESRRQTMAALYRDLPDSLNTLLTGLPQADPNAWDKSSSAKEKIDTAIANRGGHDGRASEMSKRHNSAVQKLGIKATPTITKLDNGEFHCTMRWSFWDSEQQAPVSSEAEGTGRTKVLARARASEEILVKHGHFPRLPESFYELNEGVFHSLAMNNIGDATAKAIALVEDTAVDVSAWSVFLPELLRAVLAETDGNILVSLLHTVHRRATEVGGVPVELWEGLLDEASFAIRHYHQASSALETLRDLPVAESSFPSLLEKDYFTRYRHLIALERHGGLLSGIHQYELDPNAFLSVPTVDVHHMEADKVVLTSTPESGMSELGEGNRPLRASDIVLLLPIEAVEGQAAVGADGSSDGVGSYVQEMAGVGSFRDPVQARSTNWQHAEAWMGSVTSVKGNPQYGEEIKVHTRRISRFGSDVGGADAGEDAAPISPITLGRQYKLFYIAMETPIGRQLTAMRCLCRTKAPVWHDGHEGRRPTYQFSEKLREVLIGAPETARTGAGSAVPTVPGTPTADAAVMALKGQRPWVATLTSSQTQAVKLAIEQRLSIIQGPPGTGKTHVACAIIAAWVDRYAQFGERILAVADSNVAASNLHFRLRSFGIESVRAGQTKDSAEPQLVGDVLRRAVMQAQVVVATCIGSGMEVLASRDGSGNFARVVIDECTQACEPAALVALGKMAEQTVLVGDHKQLPATVLSKLAQRDGLGISLFERMANSNGVEPTLLQEQRRMHSSIAAFPNMTFYNGQLINAIDDSALAPVPGFAWPNPECRVAFVDVSADDAYESKRGFSSYNTGEANAVAGVIVDMLNSGVEPQEIGVLTAYLAQKAEIIRALQARGIGHMLPAITVDTVDGYQGMERDIVLFSATRSNSRRVLGFVSDNRRMNVMLTRARRGLVVFGHGDTLRYAESHESHWGSWLDWVEQNSAIVSHSALLSGAASPGVSVGSNEASSSVSNGDTNGADATQGYAQLGGQHMQIQQESAAQVQSAPIPGPPAAPDAGWSKIWSEQYSANYFWNKSTGQTQWETPSGFVE